MTSTNTAAISDHSGKKITKYRLYHTPSKIPLLSNMVNPPDEEVRAIMQLKPGIKTVLQNCASGVCSTVTTTAPNVSASRGM